MNIELKLAGLSLAQLMAVHAALAAGTPNVVVHDEVAVTGPDAEAKVAAALAEVTGPGTSTPIADAGNVPPPPSGDVPPPPTNDAPPPPPPGATPPVELDADGYPWDARIHSSGKTKYAKKGPNGNAGTWKLKKGVDADTITDVRAEYVPATEAADAPDAPADTTDDSVNAALDALEGMVPTITYASVCQRITANLAPNGKLDPMAMGAMLGGFGLTGLADLANRADLLPQVNDKINELLA